MSKQVRIISIGFAAALCMVSIMALTMHTGRVAEPEEIQSTESLGALPVPPKLSITESIFTEISAMESIAVESIAVPEPEESVAIAESVIEESQYTHHLMSVSQDDVSTEVSTPVEPPKVEPSASDIVQVNVRLYNDYHEGYNSVDGRAYINDIAGYLQKNAPQGLRISVGCAMAYTEGGSGKYGVYTLTNNCFGIRATSRWDGWVFARNHDVVYKDYATAVANGGADFFCAYPTMEDSVKHYCSLMAGKRYSGAFAYDNDEDYIAYILSHGYGEARLARSWLSIIAKYNTTQYNM